MPHDELVGKYGWSTDEEVFHGAFETREAALKEGREYTREDRPVWTCKFEPLTIECRAISVLEQVQEDAQEDAGEAAEGWPYLNENEVKELQEILTRELNGFLKKTDNMPSFAKAVEIEKHERESKVGAG